MSATGPVWVIELWSQNNAHCVARPAFPSGSPSLPTSLIRVQNSASIWKERKTMKFRTLICSAATLCALMAIPLQLAAQEPVNDRHRKLSDPSTVAGPKSHQTHSPKGLVLSHGEDFRLNYWSLLSVLLDDQNGAPSVDPLSLQPPAILQTDTTILHTYKACWKVAHPGPLDPPGTAIKCYSGPGTFELGDGSLASTPNSNPDELFSVLL